MDKTLTSELTNCDDDEVSTEALNYRLTKQEFERNYDTAERLDQLKDMIQKFGMSAETMHFIKSDTELSEYLDFQITKYDKDKVLERLNMATEGFWKDFMRGGPITALIGMYLESVNRLLRVLNEEKTRITPHADDIDPIRFVTIKSFYLDNHENFTERLPALRNIVSELSKLSGSHDLSQLNLSNIVKDLRLCGYVVKDEKGQVMDGGDLSGTASMIMIVPGLIGQSIGTLHSSGGLHNIGMQIKSATAAITAKANSVVGAAKSVNLKSQAKNIVDFFTSRGIASKAVVEASLAKNAVSSASMGKRLLTMMYAVKASSIFKFFVVAQPIEFVIAASLELVATNIFAYPIGARGWKPADAVPAINICLGLLNDVSTIKQVQSNLERQAKIMEDHQDEETQKIVKRNMRLIHSCVDVYCHQTVAIARGVAKMAQDVTFIKE